MTLTANAEAPPGGSPDPRLLTGRHALSGVRVVTMTPATAEQAGVDPFMSGVMIQDIDRRARAARILRAGDVIYAVNGAAVRDAAQLERAMSQAASGTISVDRGGQRADLRF